MPSREARKIAEGHAFEKHVTARNEFPGIITKEQFAEVVEDIMTSPASLSKDLSRGRKIWWDPKTGTVVIRDPANVDGGTVFKPRNSREYFDNLR
jgi:hypothetical protein